MVAPLIRSPIGRDWEVGIWADGTEGEDMVERWRKDVQVYFNRAAERYNPPLIFGEVRIIVKRPGEDRVPPVPKDVQGPNVRFLVAEATCVGLKA